MKYIKTCYNKILFLGPLKSIQCFKSRLRLRVLKLYFNFDSWHVTSGYECRPYKARVIDALEEIPSAGLIEIGCGLGDIFTLLKKNDSTINYYGFDISTNVISTAKYLSKTNKNCFSVGSFESIKTLDSNNYNTILMLNWPHEVNPIELSELIMSNTSKNICFLIIDAIHVNQSKEFKYKHSARELIQLGLGFKLIKTVDNIDHIRDLLIFERL
jgi:hypothetical protein